MHGPPLTIDEIAALLAREVAGLTRLGAELDLALKVVAERHHIPASTVGELLVRHRRVENRKAGRNLAAA